MGRVRTELVRDMGDLEEESKPYRFFGAEVIRALLALVFAAFLLIAILWGFIRTGASEQVWAQTKELLELLLPAITALLGSAIGFYFGTQRI